MSRNKTLEKRLLDAYYKSAHEYYFNDEYKTRNALYYAMIDNNIDDLIHVLQVMKKDGSRNTTNILAALNEFVKQCNEVEKDDDNFTPILADLSDEALSKVTPLLKGVQENAVSWFGVSTQHFLLCDERLRPLKVKTGMLKTLCYTFQSFAMSSRIAFNPDWAKVCGGLKLILYEGKPVEGRRLQQEASKEVAFMTHPHEQNEANVKAYNKYLKYKKIDDIINTI